MVRYLGWYANAARGKRRREAEQGNAAGLEARSREEPEDAFARRARLSWAKLIRKVYEVDPLRCAHCGSEMRILSFLLDPPVLRRILDPLAQHRGAEARDPPLPPERLAS